MLAAEQQPAGHTLYASSIKTDSENPHEVADHVQQLIEAGFIDGAVHFHGPDSLPNAVIHRVKNPGHDFLQAMREDTIWKMVKEKVMIPTASWTLALAVEYAKRILRERLGLP